MIAPLPCVAPYCNDDESPIFVFFLHLFCFFLHNKIILFWSKRPFCHEPSANEVLLIHIYFTLDYTIKASQNFDNNCIHLFATYGDLKILTGCDLLSTTKISSEICAINYNP